MRREKRVIGMRMKRVVLLSLMVVVVVVVEVEVVKGE